MLLGSLAAEQEHRMTEPDITAPQIVKHITKALGEDSDLTEEHVLKVLDLWNKARAGDPVGTVRKDPATGAVAHRVNADGVHIWRISQPDGYQYNDMQPTLGWP